MGNIFSCDLSSFIDHCWNCAAREAEVVCQLEDNVEALKTATQELKDLRDDVTQRIRNEEGPKMKRTKQVEGWLSRVEDTLTEVDELLEAGDQEIKKLCFGGCCSKNYKSSCILGKKVAKRKEVVVDLKNKGSFDSVVERVATDPLYIAQVENSLQNLKIEKEELKGLKEDVMRRVNFEELEKRKKRLDQVQIWLSRVEDTINQADELTRDGEQEIQKLRLGGSNDMFCETVTKVLEDVIALKSKGDFKVVAERALADPVVERNCEPTVGLESMLQKVQSCLLEQDMGVIGIFGIGGVGKTTLLTQINNQFLNTPNDFDLVIWVTVSKDLRIERIQNDIWTRLGFVVDENWKKKSIDQRAEDIFNVLHKKKFILLLDDIWKQVNLKKLGIPLPKSQRSSKVVFTTRSETVCGQMGAEERIKVEPLEWEKAWKLFEETFGEVIREDIYPLAQDVAKECGGLPIALITVARAMACKRTPHEWVYAIQILRKSGSRLQGMEDEVFDLLKFSYDNLPDDSSRSCFLYCALFPEDFKISKDDLIEYWICEDFCSHEEGYEIVGNLVRGCLLEDGGIYVKMHDVIRDMALWIACECEKVKENFLVLAGAELNEAPEIEKWKEVKRISLMNNNIQELKYAPVCPNLSTLLLGGNRNLDINDGFFKYMDKLAVLDLSHTFLGWRLPREVSKVKSLQYLNLSSTALRVLPQEFKMPVKLKYLNLEDNQELHMIPKRVISNLSLLQVLRMFNPHLLGGEIDENCIWTAENLLVEELQCLKHLHTLTITIRGWSSTVQSLFNTPRLSSCTRALHIAYASGHKSLNISSPANMKQLEEINITHVHDLEELNVEFDLMGTDKFIQVPGNLRMGEGCYNNLQRVIVECCYALSDLTWLIILSPNLTFLRLKFCTGMKEIISAEKLGVTEDKNLNLFSKLQVLELVNCRALKSIYWKALSFPCLKKIRVYKCRQLKKLPLNSQSTEGSQVVIEGHKIWLDNLEWEDDATKAAFLPYFEIIPSRQPRYYDDPEDYYFS